MDISEREALRQRWLELDTKILAQYWAAPFSMEPKIDKELVRERSEIEHRMRTA